jgi:hypothetical protein
VSNDPLTLDVGADHETGDVGEEEQRHVERVAGGNEARRLVGGIDEQHPALLARLVGDDTDGASFQAGVADHQLLRPAGVHLAERTGVQQRLDELLDVEGRLLVIGDDLRGAPLPAGLGWRRRGRPLPPVGGHVREVTLGEIDRLFVGLDQEVSAPRDTGVHLGPAHLLEAHLLADHHLGHPRRPEIHRRVAVAHDHHVAERRDVGAAGGRRAEQQADLRHLAREQDLVVEDPPRAAAPREHLHLLGDSRPGRVDQVDHRQLEL